MKQWTLAALVAATLIAGSVLAVPDAQAGATHAHHVGLERRTSQHPPRRTRKPMHWQYGITPRMLQIVARVNLCEEGGDWHVRGTTFRGGLGWRVASDATGRTVPDSGPWHQFRFRTFPRDMASATPRQQAFAMFRFVAFYGMAMPDQAGCTGGY